MIKTKKVYVVYKNQLTCNEGGWAYQPAFTYENENDLIEDWHKPAPTVKQMQSFRDEWANEYTDIRHYVLYRLKFKGYFEPNQVEKIPLSQIVMEEVVEAIN